MQHVEYEYEAKYFICGLLGYRETCDFPQRPKVEKCPCEEERHRSHRRLGFGCETRLKQQLHRHTVQPQSGNQEVLFTSQHTVNSK